MFSVQTGILILLIIFFILGFFSILFGLPGTWIILIASVLYGWATGFKKVSLALLIILALLTIIAEVLEYILGMAGAERFGASRKGALASIAGGLIGSVLCAPILLGFGALIGLFAGAFLGTFFYELCRQRDLAKSLNSGIGALIGRFSATLMKLLLAIGMIAAVLRAVY